MDILNFDPNSHRPPLRQSITYFFQQLKFLQVHTPNRYQPYFYFAGPIMLSKSKQYLHGKFKVKITQDKVINFQLNLNPQICTFSSWLLQFFQKRFREISHFVYITNNLRLNQRQGVVSISEQTGNIAYKTSIKSIRMLTSRSKQQTVIVSHIRKIIKIYSETIQNMMLYYRIPGFNLNELQIMMQEHNAVPLKGVAEKIILLKTYFDQHRCNANSQHQEVIRQSKILLKGENFLDSLIKSKIKQEYFYKIESQFKNQQKMLSKTMMDLQQIKFDSILTAIQIKRKIMQLPITKGGFSQITYGIYNFVPLFSVHEQIFNSTAQKLATYTETDGNKQQNERKSCCLAKKVSKTRQSVTKSLKNQMNFLTYMKAKVCPYFAKYYCNKNITPFADGQIYIQYYPTSLDQTKLREEGKLKVLEDVCMGLFFLSRQQILHRDLKELNIMVDRNKRGRIIDFGSVSAFSKSQKFKLYNPKLLSTPGYYISYKDLRQKYPQVYKHYSKDQYYRHPNFDMLSLGKIIFNEFSLQMIRQEGQFIRQCLYYLSTRCREVDPSNRWRIGQVLCFIRQLLMYIEYQNSFWKFGFQQHCKAHLIGTTLNLKSLGYQQRLA